MGALGRIQPFAAPTHASPRPGRGKPRPRPLLDECALELGQGPEEMQDQLPVRMGGVDAFLKTLQAHTLRLEVLDLGDQILHRPPQPVQSPDHECVPRPEMIEGPGQAGVVGAGTGPINLSHLIPCFLFLFCFFPSPAWPGWQ